MANVRPPDKPWSTQYQKQADDTFDALTSVSTDELRALRPPLPQIQWLPDRFGYPPYIDRQWGVLQVFGITRTPSGNIPSMPTTRGDDRVDYSRDQATSQGSDRNTGSGDPLGLGGASW